MVCVFRKLNTHVYVKWLKLDKNNKIKKNLSDNCGL